MLTNSKSKRSTGLAITLSVVLASTQMSATAASSSEIKHYLNLSDSINKELAIQAQQNSATAFRAKAAFEKGDRDEVISLIEGLKNQSQAKTLDLLNVVEWLEKNAPEKGQREIQRSRTGISQSRNALRNALESLQFPYLSSGLPNRALATCEQLIEMDKSRPPEDPMTNYLTTVKKCDCLVWSGRLEEAKAILSSLNDTTKSLQHLGDIAFYNRKPDEAEYFYSKALSICKSGHDSLYFNLAKMSAMKGNTDKARELLKTGLEVFKSKNANLGIPNEYYEASAIVKLYSKDFVGAVRDFELDINSLNDLSAGMLRHKIAFAQLWQYFACTACGDQEKATKTEQALKPLMGSLPLLQIISKNYAPDFTATNAFPVKDKNRPIGKVWALVIGISKFADSKIDLKYAAKDAKDFLNYLTSVGLPQNQTKALLNEQATRENIMDAVGDSWLPKSCAEDDVAIVYISTHGTPANRDIGAFNYFVAHDTNKEKLYSTAISMQTFTDLLGKRIKTDRILFILDTCYSAGLGQTSGEFGNISTRRLADLTGQIILCSSDLNERSWESIKTENGIFTGKLIEMLQTNKSDNSLSEFISKLRNIVSTEVKTQYNAEQHPQMAGAWGSKDLALDILTKGK